MLKRLWIFGLLSAVSGQKTNEIRNHEEKEANPRILPQQYTFEYQTSYNGLVVTMKDELIEQLKNTMLSAVLDQEFMQSLLSNYWSI